MTPQTETRLRAPNFRCELSVGTNRLAKRLKTIELHIKRTLDSQIESREYEGQCRVVKRHQSDISVSFCHERSTTVRMRTISVRQGTPVGLEGCGE